MRAQPLPDQVLTQIVEQSPACYIVVNRDLTIRYANPAATRDFGYTPDEIIGLSIDQILPDAHEDIEAQFTLADGPERARHDFFTSNEASARRRDGSAFPYRGAFSRIGYEGELFLTIGLRDITEDSNRNRDRVTGLPNRTAFMGIIAAMIHEHPSDPFAVLKVQMRWIHELNITFGFDAGDEAVRSFGRRLQQLAGPAATIARLESRVFGMLIPSVAPWGSDFQGLIARIVDEFEEPVLVRDEPITVGATVGASFYPGHARDAEFLLRHASIAREVAEDDPAGWAVWNPQRDVMTVNHLSLLSRLREALDSGFLSLHYQPMVDLARREVVGVEALCRWLPETSPGEFIPLAERTGLIRRIDQWVIDTAVRQAATWEAAGIRVPININISAHSFQDQRLSDRIAQTLSVWGVPPERLVLEITETAAMASPARAVATCERLRGLGIRVALDDFGTGYSSFAYLNQMRVSSVKVDRSFVSGITSPQSSGYEMLKSIIDIGHRLDLPTVCEGIEHAETERIVAALGGGIGQGFHFAHPASAQDFITWMAAAPYRVAPGD